MSDSYMPRRDARALIWMKAFAGGIARAPARFMLSPAEAANLNDVVDDFADALSVASNPDTRTRPNVRRKIDAREVAEQLIQVYYSQIKANRGIDDSSKIEIGVRPLKTSRRKAPEPSSSPLLNIIGATQGRQFLQYEDSNSPTSRRKPFGMAFLELWVAIGDDDAPRFDQARPAGLYTLNPITVEFDHAADRKRATYWARWISRRGQPGPWSSPVGMSIAA